MHLRKLPCFALSCELRGVANLYLRVPVSLCGLSRKVKRLFLVNCKAKGRSSQKYLCFSFFVTSCLFNCKARGSQNESLDFCARDFCRPMSVNPDPRGLDP